MAFKRFGPQEEKDFLVRVLKHLNMRANVRKNTIKDYLDTSKFDVTKLNQSNFVRTAKYHCVTNRGMHVYGILPDVFSISALVKYHKRSPADLKADAAMADLRAAVLEYKAYVRELRCFCSNHKFSVEKCALEELEPVDRELDRVYEDYDLWLERRLRVLSCASTCPAATCSICFEDGGVFSTTCATCRKAVHTTCLNGYKDSLGRDVVPCPTCRRNFS